MLNVLIMMGMINAQFSSVKKSKNKVVQLLLQKEFV